MDSPAFKEILDTLDANVAVVDRKGIIRYVNASWMRFAEENGDPGLRGTGIGVDYLGVCRAAARDESELSALIEAIEMVLKGELGHYAIEYPCHSPDKKRWFSWEEGLKLNKSLCQRQRQESLLTSPVAKSGLNPSGQALMRGHEGQICKCKGRPSMRAGCGLWFQGGLPY